MTAIFTLVIINPSALIHSSLLKEECWQRRSEIYLFKAGGEGAPAATKTWHKQPVRMFSVFGRCLIAKTCTVSRSCGSHAPRQSDCTADTGGGRVWGGGAHTLQKENGKQKTIKHVQVINKADPEITRVLQSAQVWWLTKWNYSEHLLLFDCSEREGGRERNR